MTETYSGFPVHINSSNRKSGERSVAGIRRFVTYIYGYENGEKGENSGFARIEVRKKECRLEIHFRGIPGMHSEGDVYLFRADAGKLVLYPIGKMQIMNGRGDYGTVFDAEKFDGTASFSKMDGIVIREKNGYLYLTKWTDGNTVAVREENLVLRKSGEDAEAKSDIHMSGVGEEIKQDIHMSEAKSNIRMPEAGVDTNQDIRMSKTGTVGNSAGKSETSTKKETDIPAGIEELQATEIPMKNIFPQFCWRDSWERMLKNHESFHPAGQSNITCLRIELRELKELPRKYWYLGNNSFLLHGFFNYHYLVLGKFERERWFIGIPGVYQQQERVMAAIFGFPEFLTVDLEFQKSPGTEEPVNRFGYWYHTLDE